VLPEVLCRYLSRACVSLVSRRPPDRARIRIDDELMGLESTREVTRPQRQQARDRQNFGAPAAKRVAEPRPGLLLAPVACRFLGHRGLQTGEWLEPSGARGAFSWQRRRAAAESAAYPAVPSDDAWQFGLTPSH
jgi:hypothetical protein